MSHDPELLNEFLVESFESLDKLDQEMVQLESRPDDREVLNCVFRRVHTIKGTCGFLEFRKLESVTHVGENLLDSLRAGRLQLNQEITSTLLSLFDAMRTILRAVESSGSEGDTDYAELVKRMTAILSGSSNATATLNAGTQNGKAVDHCNHELLAELTCEVKSPPQVEPQQLTPATPPPAPANVSVAENLSPVATEVASADGTAPAGGTAIESSLRVDVGLLDQLMNLVGELVLARNQILQFTKTQNDPGYLKTSQRLNLITSELQERVMRTRMQPISNVWNKFPRVIRDVAKLCGKEVRLEMEGKETELDKTILEAIKDPLTHIIRNAVDHGIEAPDARAARGKRREGRVLLRAYHEGGHVIIDIVDDGSGLNVEKIRTKAVEKGLITQGRAQQMSRAEIQRLIFAAGFSTAEQITNISGRGVGMDVVRSNIERIGGKVDVSSEEGAGTTLKITIPLTLAIVPALIVSSGGQRFAIPQVTLVELVRLSGEKIMTAVEEINGTCFHRLRGNLLPLVYLNAELKLRRAESGEDQGVAEQVLTIIVVKADGRQFGIVVDEVHDTEEIVVKPLGKQLKSVAVFAGATIMGDGKVALIIDVPGLARKSHVVVSSEAGAVAEAEAGDSSDTTPLEKLLIVGMGAQGRGAIPLSDVSRLEVFEPQVIERASGMAVVQYRGGILPLVDLTSYFSAASDNAQKDVKQNVVVYQANEQVVGLVVDSIVDIVEERVNVRQRSMKRGLLGSAVIQKKVTDLVDVSTVIADALSA